MSSKMIPKDEEDEEGNAPTTLHNDVPEEENTAILMEELENLVQQPLS